MTRTGLSAMAKHAAICLLVLSTLLVSPSSAQEKKSTIRKKATVPVKSDMAASQSIAAPNYQKVQSVAPRTTSRSANRRYGYPYLIAPTLPPFLEHRADTNENEAVYVKPVPPVPPVPPVKEFGSRIAENTPIKKAYQKKQKIAVAQTAERRQGYDDDEDDETSSERRLRTYREPTYRNLFELESIFRPKRIDVGLRLTDYGYLSKSSKRPVVSQRDPYSSPSGGHRELYFPTVTKMKHLSSYGSGGRIGYGAGAYDSYGGPPPPPPPPSYGYGSDGYDHSYEEPPSKYPSSSGGHYDYNDSYSIQSNKPIVGDIRKRLLDFAGASDLYEGEPDYLKEVARNKQKYGNIGNDYYPYGGPGNSFRDFHYAESVLKESRTR